MNLKCLNHRSPEIFLANIAQNPTINDIKENVIILPKGRIRLSTLPEIEIAGQVSTHIYNCTAHQSQLTLDLLFSYIFPICFFTPTLLTIQWKAE